MKKIKPSEIVEYLERQDTSTFNKDYRQGYRDAIQDVKRLISIIK